MDEKQPQYTSLRCLSNHGAELFEAVATKEANIAEENDLVANNIIIDGYYLNPCGSDKSVQQLKGRSPRNSTLSDGYQHTCKDNFNTIQTYSTKSSTCSTVSPSSSATLSAGYCVTSSVTTITSGSNSGSPTIGPTRTQNKGSAFWWQPVAALVLAVHGTLVSVGEWAWSKTLQGRIGGFVEAAQRRTSVVYETVKYKSTVAARDCQDAASSLYEDLQGRLQVSIVKSSLDRMLLGCVRCKQNVELAMLEAKLRLDLASNRAQLRTDTLRLDAKKKFAERYDDLVATPLLAVRSKMKKAGSQTGGQLNRCKTVLTGNFKGKRDVKSLNAKRYEDDFEEKYPVISNKAGKNFKVRHSHYRYGIKYKYTNAIFLSD